MNISVAAIGVEAGPPGVAPSWAGMEVLVLAPTPTHPLDAGNRRRIFHVNTALQQRGARITYVHYPAEGDWRVQAPRESIRAMQEQWEACHLVPLTRAPHPGPVGSDHLIDEWWDPAIGDMLSWLFRTHKFDVLIVNYAWLSKAFTYCPRGVLKILDTHDRFSGRRGVLEAHGIAAEFFHTTEDQERIALDRADVVWSIKHQEAAFFKTLTRRRVVNLPYAAPITPLARDKSVSGVLRFGIAGAANNINRVNIQAFLAEAEDYVRHTLLPCEIIVAGSICDLMPPSRYPWLRLIGRVADIETFYRGVDVVLAPIVFSTGLKIKVGEALCYGRAMVALEHAFEGFRPLHRFHALTSLREMMRACRDIVNRPALIDALEDLSVRSVLETQAEVEAGLDDSIAELWQVEPGLCIVLNAADVYRGSLTVDHACETAHYVGHIAAVTIFIDGESNRVRDPQAMALLARAGNLLVAPGLLAALGPNPAEVLGLRVVRTREFTKLLEDPHLAFWFASCPYRWPAPARQLPARAYIACDSVLQSTSPGVLVNMLTQLRARFREVVAVSHGGCAPVEQPNGASWRHRVPLFWHGERSFVLADLRGRRRESVVVLADTLSDPLVDMTISLVVELSDRSIEVILPDRTAAPDRRDTDRVSHLRISHCFCPRAAGAPGPALVLDLATDLGFVGVREVFDRLALPRATLFATPTRPANGYWSPAVQACGLFESARLIADLLDGSQIADEGVVRAGMDARNANDSGWAWIWSAVQDLASARDAQAKGRG